MRAETRLLSRKPRPVDGESFPKLRSGQAPGIGDVGIQDRRRFPTAARDATAGVHELLSRSRCTPSSSQFARDGFQTVTLREERSIGYVRFERGFSRGVALVEGV